MREKSVDVVICTYNNKDMVSIVLGSLKKQTFKDFKCWLADDYSTDGTIDFVKRKYPWVKCVEIKQKNGPSKNRNIAIALGTSEYFVTLDDDVDLEKSWLAKMLKFMEENPRVGIAEGKLIPATENTWPEKYACSAAMIVRRRVFEDIGGFDEDYFYALEDTDFSLRAKRYGWLVETNNSAHALHRVSYTTKRLPSSFKRFIYWRNFIRTILKNNQKRKLLVQLPLLAARLFVLFLKDVVTLNNVFSIPKAVFWNIVHLGDTLDRRARYA